MNKLIKRSNLLEITFPKGEFDDSEVTVRFDVNEENIVGKTTISLDGGKTFYPAKAVAEAFQVLSESYPNFAT